MTALGNPVEGPRIVPYGAARGVSDKLANGHAAFRVTQPFGPTSVADEPALTYNGVHYPHFHTGIDMGNFVCGDAVLAVAAGAARQHKDPAGAQAVIIDHGDGLSTYYWHLSRWAIPATQQVHAGQRIGSVGNTGLSGGCHLHFEVHLNGQKVDPWPLLRQNGATDDAPQEDDVDIIERITGQKLTLSGPLKFYRAPDASTQPYYELPAGQSVSVYPFGWVKGVGGSWAAYVTNETTPPLHRFGFVQADPSQLSAVEDGSAARQKLTQVQNALTRAKQARIAADQADGAADDALDEALRLAQ